MLHLETCNFLPHGDDLFVACDWLLPVEPCAPRFGPLIKNAASQTVFDVSLFCRTCVVFLQEHKLTLLRYPRRVSDTRISIAQGQGKAFHPSLSWREYDFTWCPQFQGKPWFLVSTKPGFNCPGNTSMQGTTTWVNQLELVSAQWAYRQRNSMLLIRLRLFSNTNWDKRLCTNHPGN